MKLAAGRERGGDDRKRRGRHQRPGQTLHGACADQQVAVGREAAGERGQREQQERRHERAPLPEVIAGPPPEHQEAGERDRIRIDHPLQFGRGEAEARLDRGQRHVDDAEVEDDHELRDAADGEQRAGVRAARPACPDLSRPRAGRPAPGRSRAARSRTSAAPGATAAGAWRARTARLGAWNAW